MIRKMEKSDIDKVMDIWLNTNISAHNFISEDYWKKNFNDVKEAVLDAEVYIYKKDDKIVGFIGLIDTYIAGLFVNEKLQSQGIGSMLLDYVKAIKSSLELNVYTLNEKAVKFYVANGFIINKEQMDENTDQNEYVMTWRNNL